MAIDTTLASAQLTAFLGAFQGVPIADRVLTGIDEILPQSSSNGQTTEQTVIPQLEVDVAGGFSRTFTSIQRRFWMSGDDTMARDAVQSRPKLTGERGLNILLEASPNGIYQTLLRNPGMTTIRYTNLSRFADDVIQNAIHFLEGKGYIVQLKIDASNQNYLEITKPQREPTFQEKLALAIATGNCAEEVLVRFKKHKSDGDVRISVDRYPYPVIAATIEILRGSDHMLDAAHEFRINGLDRYDTIVIRSKSK